MVLFKEITQCPSARQRCLLVRPVSHQFKVGRRIHRMKNSALSAARQCRSCRVSAKGDRKLKTVVRFAR
jgi:hypothetical protein